MWFCLLCSLREHRYVTGLKQALQTSRAQFANHTYKVVPREGEDDDDDDGQKEDGMMSWGRAQVNVYTEGIMFVLKMQMFYSVEH